MKRQSFVDVLQNNCFSFCKIHRKTPALESFFNKEKLQHRYFPLNSSKFLTTRFSQNTSERLLLSLIIMHFFSWLNQGIKFSRIRTEYGDLLIKSPYSVQIVKILTRKNSILGKFSRSEYCSHLIIEIGLITTQKQLFFDVL